MNVPLTVFTIIFNCAPFWTALFAHFWLGESLGWCNAISMVGSFVGVFLMAWADPVPSEQQVDTVFSAWSERARYTLGITTCLLGSVAWAIWVVLNRPLKNVHYSVISFYAGLYDTALTGVGLLLFYLLSTEKRPFTFNTNWVFFEVGVAALCSYGA